MVTTGRPERADRTAASVAVLNADDLNTLNALRIGDALAAAPGVFFAGLNGPREIPLIRQPLAFDNRVLFLEDGVPLQSSIFFDQSALAASLALAAPDRLEVLRGPGEALYGSDAFSGVVAVSTTAPTDPFTASLKARYGEFDAFDIAANLSGAISANQRLGLTLAHAGEEGFRDETAFNRAHGQLRHNWTVGALEADTILSFSRFETESATAQPFDVFVTESTSSGLSPLVDVEDAVEVGTYARASTRLAWRANDRLSLEITPYWRLQESEATATFQPATTPRTDARVETVGLLPRAYVDHGGGAQTIVGLDVELTDFDRLTVQTAPDVVVFGDLFLQGVQFDYQVAYRGLSPFFQHRRALGPLEITLGLRFDALRYDFDNALEEAPGDALFQVEDRVDRFTALSPKAGLVWPLNPSHSLFARYARGFRIPRESDLYQLEAGQAEFELEPERIDSGEIGWRWTGGFWSSELVGYWSVSRDGVITDVQTAAGNISVNAGSQRFAGIEWAGSVQAPYGVKADVAFAFQDFRFIQRAADGPDPFDGNRIAEAPRTIGNVTLNWTPPIYERALLQTRLRHIGAWPLNDANTLFSDNEFILTFIAQWRPTPRGTLDLKLENATDELFAVFADAPVFAPDGRARPGIPRTISAGVRLSY
ncbi:MAG: TonB-dependent receptor [Maricaulaceae bacterium]